MEEDARRGTRVIERFSSHLLPSWHHFTTTNREMEELRKREEARRGTVGESDQGDKEREIAEEGEYHHTRFEKYIRCLPHLFYF